MRCPLGWLAILTGSVTLTTGTAVAQSLQPAGALALPAEQMSPDDRELQQMLQQLTTLSETLLRNAESPQSWQYQLQQADLLLQIASRSKVEERDTWLKMAIENYHAAAVQSPPEEQSAYFRLVQLPAYILRYYPGCKLHSQAALQEIRADHTRMLAREGMVRSKADDHLRQRLMQFGQANPQVPEATKAIKESAQICESLGRNDEACRCYRYLAEAHARTDTAREARSALRRLGGLNGEPVRLQLPLLYSVSAGDQVFDSQELEGKLVVLSFWSARDQTAEDFESLRRLTDRYRSGGLEVVFVTMDADSSKVREFLTGRLTAGTHIVLKEGLKSPLCERYGIDTVPTMLLVGKDGRLLEHSLSASQLETVLSGHITLPMRGR
jgi:hypothetical protein